MYRIDLSIETETIIHDGREFIFLCPADKIYEGKGYQFEFDGDSDKQIALFRSKGRLYCLYNICPHRHTHLIYQGIINEGEISCPAHGWTYSLETGRNINPQQGIRSLKKFETFEQNGKIYIEKPVFDIPKWRTDFISENFL
jgi:nitrite reductase/ring-hydroxylating ferredoxin subunit